MSVLDVVIASTIVVSITALLVEAAKRFLLTLPMKLWRYLVKKLTLTVTFASHEPGFDMLREWLAAHPYAKKAREVKMQYSQTEGKFVLAPGHGSHFLWFQGPLWIRFSQAEGKNDGGIMNHKAESYSVTMIAAYHSKMERFMNELTQFKKKEVSALTVYTWRGGYWNWSGSKRKRDMNTVYMQASTKDEIISSIRRFLAAEEWYAARGIPWRLGILFKGGPGTGKTTLATALAGYFDKPMYSMNLESIGNDETLQYAFSSAQRDGIVLIEDVDGFQAAIDRGGIEREESPTVPNDAPVSGLPMFGEGEKSVTEQMNELVTKLSASSGVVTKSTGSDKKSGVTISGLLNAIDGVAATEGRILILTTNDASKLDPALLRSGRIDYHFEIGHLTPDDVVSMFKCFYPEAGARNASIRSYASHRSKTAAAWQKLFIQYHDSVEKLFTEIVDA
jgi:chaperone BCS1